MADPDPERGPARAKRVSLGATLEAASTFAELRAAPHGRWIGGESFVYAWPRRDLCATLLFGSPSPDDLAALGALFALELAPPAEPHASYIDARRVERVEPSAYAVLRQYVEAHRAAMRGLVTRLAIVRPDGFVGALAAGFYETLEPPYPVGVFEAPEAAFAWLGHDPAWIATLEALREEELPPLIRELHRVLTARLPSASHEGAARDLGLSVRTLQRRLREHGTTFRRELAAVQVRAAQRWLEETSEPVSRVAYEVGCSTPQHLSLIFRQHTGTTPTAWRASRKVDAQEPRR